MYIKPLFLVATGPSRHDYPIEELKAEGHFVMGINRVANEIPLNIAHFQTVPDYILSAERFQEGCLFVIPDNFNIDIEPSSKNFVMRYTKNHTPKVGSGITGLFIAASMGFNPIFLIGYDNTTARGNEIYIGDLELMEEFKKRHNTTLYNCNLKTRFQGSKYLPFEECRHGEI